MLTRRGFGAADLRDLVYGHLAVAQLPSRRNWPPCPVDYQRSVVVFIDATIHMIKQGMSNEVFLNIDVHNPKRRMKGLPS
jgi:hypothetical protein